MSNENETGKKLKKEIHCPVSGCVYYAGSERFFSSKKLLKQHVAKVHAEKKFHCSKCQKSFGPEWWRNYHEKSCGKDWKCDCGLKYSSREALLTHCRRANHGVPEHALKVEKLKPGKAVEKSNANTVIYLIQPIIQNMTCIQQPVRNAVLNPRPIFPKALLPLNLTPVSSDSSNGFGNPTYISTLSCPSTEGFVFSSNNAADTSTSPFLTSPNPVAETATSATPKQSCTTGTQTVDSDHPRKTRESRASQCSRRKSKRTAVGGESIQTQTAESAVVKISKKRSRRKSVAITTEPNMLVGSSYWSGLGDFMNSNEASVPKAYCASTQTSSNKVLCDSQTLTDEELFKFVLDHEAKKNCQENIQTSFDMIPSMSSGDSISMIQQNLMQEKSLSCLDMFSPNTNVVNSILNSNHDQACTNTENSFMSTQSTETSLFPDFAETSEKAPPTLSDIHTQTMAMFSPNTNVVNSILNSNHDQACTNTENSFMNTQSTETSIFPDFAETNEKAPPTLSDIHTQTMASNILDYNLLANMETQTTDDFSLYDLEFSDTETQTPWEDFPNIEDPLLQADQLSIEIQTDFSFLSNSDYQHDPYDFINGLSLSSECSSKESLGVNIQTQTQDRFTFPQFANSECQTLDLSLLFPTNSN